MGVEQYESIIATTWDDNVVNELKEWIWQFNEEERSLFVFIPALVNAKTTLFLATNGSKRGRETESRGREIRSLLIDKLESFAYEDGSNSIKWIEVSYGERGQRIVDGNCTTDMYS